MQTIGSRIRDARVALDRSQTDLARALGVDQSSVALWEKDKTLPRPAKMEDLARALYVTPEFLSYGDRQAIPPGRSVPVIGYVGPGNEIHRFKAKAIGEALAPPAAPEDNIRMATAAVVVRGTSMWPVYREGDVLFFNDKDTLSCEKALGIECIAQVKDGAAMVKRVLKGNRRGVYTLASYNAPELHDMKVEWCAPIIWIRRNQAPSD